MFHVHLEFAFIHSTTAIHSDRLTSGEKQMPACFHAPGNPCIQNYQKWPSCGCSLAQVRGLLTLGTPHYLALARCAGRSSHCPHGAAEPRKAMAVQASFPDVIGDIISQAGVTDTAGTTFPFQDSCVLAAQTGASERPAVYLSFLWRKS